MYFGQNLQYLRKTQGITQEKMAYILGVSRQTISKWESGEVCPEIPKLLELCEIFSCSMDTLLREDLSTRNSSRYPVRLERIQGFRYAGHLVISKNPREDSQSLLTRWCRRIGLMDPVFLGWSFPHLSQVQKQRFGLRGYVSAVVLPPDFESWVPGPELHRQETADYAVMTIENPGAQIQDQVTRALGLILEYLGSTPDVKKMHSEGILPSFQRLYEMDGTEYLDVYVHCRCTRSPDTAVDFTAFFT